jgi:hypothetical protein
MVEDEAGFLRDTSFKTIGSMVAASGKVLWTKRIRIVQTKEKPLRLQTAGW